MRALCVLAILAMATGCAGRRRVEYRPPEGPQVAGQQGWAWPEVSPPEAGLSCRMPAVPRLERRIGREVDGAFYRTVTARAELPYGSFGVIVTEWEGGLVGDPLEAAAEIADDIFSEQSLRQRQSQRLDIPGFYGREDTGVAPNGVFVALRQFVGQRRIYIAVAIVTHAQAPLRTAETFMGSIRLDTADALLPVAGSSDGLATVYMPETDFAVRMPPIQQRRTEELELGDRTVTSHSFTAEMPDVRMRVRVIDLPGGADAELQAEIARVLTLGERGGPVSASGFPGITFTRTNGSVAIDARLYITASRVYVVEVAQPSSRPASSTARAFFDSFRIL